jgi:hypothetical protein
MISVAYGHSWFRSRSCRQWAKKLAAGWRRRTVSEGTLTLVPVLSSTSESHPRPHILTRASHPQTTPVRVRHRVDDMKNGDRGTAWACLLLPSPPHINKEGRPRDTRLPVNVTDREHTGAAQETSDGVCAGRRGAVVCAGGLLVSLAYSARGFYSTNSCCRCVVEPAKT